METINSLLHALWQHDYQTLANPKLVWTLYIVLFSILLLENGVIPAAFLPGDTLLFLTGVLAAKGALSIIPVILILTIGASLGTWLGHAQGLWLSNTRLIRSWMEHLPEKYHQRAHTLFHRHGLAALFIGRFIGFVRTVLPMLAGISGLKGNRFHVYNWSSAFLWVSLLVSSGYVLGKTKIFLNHEQKLMSLLMMIPVALLIFGLLATLVVVLRKKRRPATVIGEKTHTATTKSSD